MSFDHRIDYIFTHFNTWGWELRTVPLSKLPYEIHSHSFCLRPYSLVVGPSPAFPHRSLAADYPSIFFIFKPSRLLFPAALWLKEFLEVPAIHPVMLLSIAR